MVILKEKQGLNYKQKPSKDNFHIERDLKSSDLAPKASFIRTGEIIAFMDVREEEKKREMLSGLAFHIVSGRNFPQK